MRFSLPHDPDGRPCLPSYHPRSQPRSPNSPTPIPTSSNKPKPRTCWPTWPPCPTPGPPVAAATRCWRSWHGSRRGAGRGAVDHRDRRMGRRYTPGGAGRARRPPASPRLLWRARRGHHPPHAGAAGRRRPGRGDRRLAGRPAALTKVASHKAQHQQAACLLFWPVGAVWWRRRSTCQGGTPPRPDAIDLHLQRETQKRPDEHDQPQDTNVLKGGFDGYGSDDVGRHQKLQSQQNAPAKDGPDDPVGGFSTPAVEQDVGTADEGYRQARYNRRDPKDFDASGDLLHRSCHAHPCRRGTCRVHPRAAQRPATASRCAGTRGTAPDRGPP
jgi:hypothetical protein